jgi:uncharacterized repeat protein (TIGR03803 family)
VTHNGGIYGDGLVFQLRHEHGEWGMTVLHNFDFDFAQDGVGPNNQMIFDSAGNLYGTTTFGGANNSGTVYELTPEADGSWTEQILWNFNQGSGSEVQCCLVFDAAGDLYGTAFAGGQYNQGTVFELIPQAGGAWTAHVLHSFGGDAADGKMPSGVIFDAAGNLYGTTTEGGLYSLRHRPYGIAFKLTPEAGGAWTETILHSFGGGKDGAFPSGNLFLDAHGNLYGTTQWGGTKTGPLAYSGTLFEIELQ